MIQFKALLHLLKAATRFLTTPTPKLLNQLIGLPQHNLNPIVDWPSYLIGPLALLLVVSHSSESHSQVYGWGLRYVDK